MTEVVNVRTTELVAVPYLTLRVPLNEHVPFSCEHHVQLPLVAAAVTRGESCETSWLSGIAPDSSEDVTVSVGLDAPPQAARIIESAATTARDFRIDFNLILPWDARVMGCARHGARASLIRQCGLR
jgi:hypothetical protein